MTYAKRRKGFRQHPLKQGPATAFILVANLPDDPGVTNTFLVKHRLAGPKEAIDAVREETKKWLATMPEGKEAWEHGTSEDFNWGDMAVYDVPLPKGVVAFESIPAGQDPPAPKGYTLPGYTVYHDEVLGQ